MWGYHFMERNVLKEMHRGKTLEEKLFYLKKYLTFWDMLTVQQRELLIRNTAAASYSKGETIYSAEHECVGILILQHVEIRTYILSEEGREVTLFRLGAGEICVLSASCILKSITFDVHIEAEQDSEILVLNSAVFSRLMEDNIHAELFALRLAAEKFSEVMWAMEQILFLNFDARLSIFLLDETAKTGENTLQLTHEQIARYIGSAREVVTRMLHYFVDEGAVALTRGRVTVLDKKYLQAIAAQPAKQ